MEIVKAVAFWCGSFFNYQNLSIGIELRDLEIK